MVRRIKLPVEHAASGLPHLLASDVGSAMLLTGS
jgi:hypothetical protein